MQYLLYRYLILLLLKLHPLIAQEVFSTSKETPKLIFFVYKPNHWLKQTAPMG